MESCSRIQSIKFPGQFCYRRKATPPPANRESDESMEEGELSEEELEQKRRELLEKLRESD